MVDWIIYNVGPPWIFEVKVDRKKPNWLMEVKLKDQY